MSQLTRAQLAASIAANLADNTSGAITPAILRSVLNSMVDSSPNLIDGPGLVDPTITSWALLAAVVTAGLTVPRVIVWVESTTKSSHISQLRAGTDATDTASGIQRPSDYNAGTNAVVWYDA
jgi:hypothetical protein